MSLVCAKYHIHPNALKLSNNWDGSSELLVNHKSKDSHHSSTAVVKLDSTLGKLGLLIEGVPSEVKSSVTEVTNEFSLAGNILHYSKLKSSNEGDDLEKTGLWDGTYSGPSVRDGVEGSSCGVDVTWKVDSGTGGDLSEESKLGDTSVLDLYVTEAVETLLVSIIKKSKRIEESKRRLGTKLGLEGVEGAGGLCDLGRSEGGSGGDEGGGNGKLHFECCW
mmetsp:Transcript_12324/g.8628  ORF Transcript_12324/g.8628 Transcript_12324/m.8628 type:complete len:220 (-) Transcript_12324:26-685(-)